MKISSYINAQLYCQLADVHSKHFYKECMENSYCGFSQNVV